MLYSLNALIISQLTIRICVKEKKRNPPVAVCLLSFVHPVTYKWALGYYVTLHTCF